MESSNRKKTVKILIAILLVAVIVTSVILVIVLKKDKSVLGVEVNGKIYEYSAEKGIADYQNIEGKVYVSDIISVYSYEIGSSEAKECKDLDAKQVTTYIVPNAYTGFNSEDSLQEKIFVINKNYKTEDGITNKNTIEDAKNKGYRVTFGNEYIKLIDSKGNDSWDEADALVNQISADGSFECIKYLDKEFISILPDMVKFDYLQDNPEEFFSTIEAVTESDAKELVSCLIARAELMKKITDGEIDFFVEKRFSQYRITEEGNMPVDIHVVTLKENIEKWDDNWGVTLNK